jgi:hypothetical protein
MFKPLVALTIACTVATAQADVVEPTPTLDQPAPIEEPAAASVDFENIAVKPPSSYAPQPLPEGGSGGDADETPPVSGARLFGELAVGGLFAVGGGVGGAVLGFGLETNGGCHSEFCGLGGIVIGGIAGLAFVTPVGVYLVGSAGDETGSFAATLGGSVLGTLAGIAAAAGSGEEDAAAVLLVAGPVLGSMAGFNLTRKYDPSHKRRNWAPVASVSHGNTSFGVVGRF